MFTSTEKKAIIFLCSLLLLGGFLKIIGVTSRFHTDYEERKVLKININEASLEDLDKIPFIGVKTARQIIKYRKDNGHFNSLEELKGVKGIGDKKASIIKKFITF